MSSIFIFHRDLRLEDNKALNVLLEKSKNIIPLFVLTPEQINNNSYKSDNSVQFMTECLKSLNKSLEKLGSHLHILYGDTLQILQYYIDNYDINYLAFNKDYTPYAKERDSNIKNFCKEKGIEIIIEEDYTLLPLDRVVTGKGTFYKVFSPFYKNHIQKTVPKPFTSNDKPFSNIPLTQYQIQDKDLDTIFKSNSNVYVRGGRSNGLSILTGLKNIDYDKIREKPMTTTTLLSAHIKFGTVSIREVYYKGVEVYGKNSEFVKQIIWHDFYASLMNGLDEKDTLGGGNYRHLIIEWENNEEWFKKWTQGKTGFPIVDAGIRQMNKTGWMHNQARMIVANFLTVILNIDWKWGEHYFAINLIDYDPASNNGNWQWSVQVGVDRPRSYPRIYNPWSYAQKKDGAATYIKEWIPELKDISVKDIHSWDKNYYKYPNTYVKPIVNYEERRDLAKTRFRDVEKY